VVLERAQFNPHFVSGVPFCLAQRLFGERPHTQGDITEHVAQAGTARLRRW
jgi:hypothetical protein